MYNNVNKVWWGEGGCVGVDCGLKEAHMGVLIPALASTPSLRHLSLGGELPFLVSLRKGKKTYQYVYMCTCTYVCVHIHMHTYT